MIWPRHGWLSNCCSVSFRRAQRNLLNSRLQSKLFCCSHPRRWRKVRYIFTKSLILSTHVLSSDFCFFVERRVYGVLIICALHYCSILLTSLKHVHHKTAIKLLKTRFFRQSNNQLDSSKNYSYYTLCIIVCTKVPSPKRTTDSLLGPQCFATRGQKEEEFVQCCRLFFYNMATCLM